MLAHLRSRASFFLTRISHSPRVDVQRSSGLLRLGSEYGGWTFEPSPDLHDSVIVSCGLGEDASFDVEFASRFGAKVVIVDPTPRAIRHFEGIQDRAGQPAVQGYATNGNQPISAYDLVKVARDSLILEPSALYVENTRLKFFAPANPDHVSHSIVNYQNDYRDDTSHLEVSAITLEALLAKYQLKTPPLIKLDIEGAEIAVIGQMLDKSVRPRQLLVEFDELNVPSHRAKKNTEDTHRRLMEAGYVCRSFDGRADFLYVLRGADA